MTYVYEEFSSGFGLTPANFLKGNCNNTIPFTTDVIEDEMEYLPKNKIPVRSYHYTPETAPAIFEILDTRLFIESEGNFTIDL